MARQPMTVYLIDDNEKELNAMSNRTGVAKSAIVNLALYQFFNHKEVIINHAFETARVSDLKKEELAQVVANLMMEV